MGGGTKAEEMERSTWVRGAAGKGGTKDEAGRSGARETGWKGSQEKDLLLGWRSEVRGPLLEASFSQSFVLFNIKRGYYPGGEAQEGQGSCDWQTCCRPSDPQEHGPGLQPLAPLASLPHDPTP